VSFIFYLLHGNDFNARAAKKRKGPVSK